MLSGAGTDARGGHPCDEFLSELLRHLLMHIDTLGAIANLLDHHTRTRERECTHSSTARLTRWTPCGRVLAFEQARKRMAAPSGRRRPSGAARCSLSQQSERA